MTIVIDKMRKAPLLVATVLPIEPPCHDTTHSLRIRCFGLLGPFNGPQHRDP